MSRFVQGFDSDDARLGGAPISTGGGTVTGNITSTVTPSSGGAVSIKSQVDTLAAAGGAAQNGVRVFSLMASQADGWYGHSNTCTCNWTVPANTSRVFIQVWGGGGAGGGFRCRDHGTPGGAAGYTHGFFTVQGGDILCIQAGRGGCRACCCRHGCPGVISYVCNATRSIQIRSYPGTAGLCSFRNYSGEGGCFGCGVGGQLNLCGMRDMSDTQCSCHRYCSSGRMNAYFVGAAPPTFGGYWTATTGSSFFCGGGCGLPNCSPGGGGAFTGVSYPTTAKSGAGGPGLVMIWH